MDRYQKTHDGLVIVEGAGALYIGTAVEFAQDRGAAAPGAAGIVIAPGRHECLIDADGNQGAHGLSVAQRNTVTAIIAAAPALVAAKVAREQVAPDAPQAPLPLETRQRIEMHKRGMTTDAIALALLDNDVVALAALRAIRDAVKVEIV